MCPKEYNLIMIALHDYEYFLYLRNQVKTKSIISNQVQSQD